MQVQSAKTISLSTLKGKVDKGRINLRPEYQRYFVWGRNDQQLFIKSILKEMYIPEIVFRVIKNQKGKEFDVVDGQQRVNSAVKFLNDEVKIGKGTIIDNNDYSGLRFSELPEDIKERLSLFTLNYVQIDGTDEEIKENFLVLQMGKALKNVEVRHSKGGSIRDFVNEILKHPFFSDTCGCDENTNTRMMYNEIIEQMLVLELYGIIDIRKKEIDKMYEDYNELGIPQETREKIENILDYLYNTFGNKETGGIFKKANIHGLYMLMSEYINQDLQQKNVIEFGEWFKSFEVKRKEVKSQPDNKQEEPYRTYNNKLIGGTGSKDSLQVRKDILLKNWLDYLNANKKEAESTKGYKKSKALLDTNADA